MRAGVDVEGVVEVGVVVGVERECATCCEGGQSQDQGRNQSHGLSQRPESGTRENQTRVKTFLQCVVPW